MRSSFVLAARAFFLFLLADHFEIFVGGDVESSESDLRSSGSSVRECEVSCSLDDIAGGGWRSLGEGSSFGKGGVEAAAERGEPGDRGSVSSSCRCTSPSGIETMLSRW
eukprot:CAMPEP_0117439194 /NCGR_PEP_ID=MMETSP0759-20121206/2441_1 /TAXON_ID=63605 /ORGANISM="Percolomonas cosmopolitus, Strain WS" /LENGTH=108 /DNA_ID=CAMNT_0005230905 /DNA_START=52 /DNA_END=375 /DNA_ORIENTATION=-